MRAAKRSSIILVVADKRQRAGANLGLFLRLRLPVSPFAEQFLEGCVDLAIDRREKCARKLALVHQQAAHGLLQRGRGLLVLVDDLDGVARRRGQQRLERLAHRGAQPNDDALRCCARGLPGSGCRCSAHSDSKLSPRHIGWQG
jgi:hypothetical protein